MSNTEENSEDGPRDRSIEDLEAKLLALLGGDALKLIDFQYPDHTGDADAREKHNASTAQYKRSQAASLTPGSEAVGQACAFIAQTLMKGSSETSNWIFSKIVRELVEAGYDQEQSQIVVRRLKVGVTKRKVAWRHRARARLGHILVEELRARKRNT